MSNAVALVNKDKIIEMVANGAMLQQVAKSFGIAAPNISKHLANDPDYKQAREIGTELRLHLAFQRMDECAEGQIIEDEESGEKVLVESKGNLARAREAAFRAAAWFAEREFPAKWGKQAEVQIVNVTVNQVDGSALDLLGQVRGQVGANRLIEHDAEQHNDADNPPTT